MYSKPDVSEAIGAPFSTFLSQYPFLPIGRGKNGSPVNYFLAGRINPEGMLSLSTKEQLTGYFWWSFIYKFRQEIRDSQRLDPDFVRLEGINILDLSGLSSSALSSDTMDVIKMASKISDFFPEVRDCSSAGGGWRGGAVLGWWTHIIAHLHSTYLDITLHVDSECTGILFHVLGYHQEVH